MNLDKELALAKEARQIMEAEQLASESERMFNAIKRIKIIARGMFEAKVGQWFFDDHHVYVRIRPDKVKWKNEIARHEQALVVFRFIGPDWQIVGISNIQDIDLDYMESFDKIDRT